VAHTHELCSTEESYIVKLKKEKFRMDTMTPKQIRITTLLMFIFWISVAMTGQTLWTSLQTLGHSVAQTLTASRPLLVDAGPPALLLLNTDVLVAPLNGGAATLTARVRDAVGKPVAGIEVQFQSEAGTLSPTTALTDAEGAANTTFTAGGMPGQAMVTAVADGFTQTAAIQIVKPNTDATTHALALEIGGSQVDHGQQTALTIQLRDAAGQPVAGELVSFFGALGEVSPASAVTDADGRATAQFQAGTISGQALITALAGSVSKSVSIQVGDKVAPPTPDAGGSHSIYLPMVTK
jgi:hypothetical protein